MLSVPVLSQTTLIQDLLVLIFALQMVAGVGGDLQRRQTDPCLNLFCGWVTGLDACGSTDTACICAVFVTGFANISTCVTCEQAVNASFAFEILTLYEDCASATSTASSVGPAPVTGSAPLITSSVAGALPNATSATTSTTSTISITSPTRSGSGSIQEQTKRGIWIGVITLSAIVVGLVALV